VTASLTSIVGHFGNPVYPTKCTGTPYCVALCRFKRRGRLPTPQRQQRRPYRLVGLMRRLTTHFAPTTADPASVGVQPPPKEID